MNCFAIVFLSFVSYKPEDPIFVAMRGGSWFTSAKNMRVSVRGFGSANRKFRFSGFRCAGD
jgi:formylglycine-generating enzyme required for sulfatase activity